MEDFNEVDAQNCDRCFGVSWYLRDRGSRPADPASIRLAGIVAEPFGTFTVSLFSNPRNHSVAGERGVEPCGAVAHAAAATRIRLDCGIPRMRGVGVDHFKDDHVQRGGLAPLSLLERWSRADRVRGGIDAKHERASTCCCALSAHVLTSVLTLRRRGRKTRSTRRQSGVERRTGGGPDKRRSVRTGGKLRPARGRADRKSTR